MELGLADDKLGKKNVTLDRGEFTGMWALTQYLKFNILTTADSFLI